MGSRKSNAYLAAYLGRTEKNTGTQKNARYMKHTKLENIFAQTLLRTHNVYGNMNTYAISKRRYLSLLFWGSNVDNVSMAGFIIAKFHNASHRKNATK